MKKISLPIFASFLAALSWQSVQAAEPVPNAQAGAGKVAMCIGCHGIADYKASFPQVYRVPKISGQSASYIVAALKEYQTGARKFGSMQAAAAPLSEQDMADIAAYYSQQTASKAPPAVPAPSAKVQALLDRGNCISCHGVNFSAPIDASTAKIAGQHPDYLYAALKAYSAPETGVAYGRSNAVMVGTVKGKFSSSELQQLAGYIASLPGEVHTEAENRFR